jgi:putative ABC transport system permease protein
LFFLPLVTAIVHSAVALNIVADCLRLVLVVHMPTFVGSVAVVCVLFSVVYGIVYKITSREYYGIVNE